MGFTFGAVDLRHFFTVGFIDCGLGIAFRLFNLGLTLTIGQVDLLDFAAFRFGNARAFFTLGSDLLLHRAQNFLRRHQVFDFVTQDFHAPRHGCFVQSRHHGAVDVVTLFKSLVQLHAADDRTQSGLCQLGNRQDIVTAAIRGQLWVGHLEVQHAVYRQLGVVTGDTHLAGHIQGNFF